MTTLEALKLPDGHIRVMIGPCATCGNVRPFAIHADKAIHEGEESMDIREFLDAVLEHCEDFHFHLTPAMREARQKERKAHRTGTLT